MEISLIVAYGRNRAIGKDNRMPWHLPADLALFKKITMGCPVIMGRNTFLSIGKPLPGRQNIVVSRSGNVHHDGVRVVPTLEAAMQSCANAREAFIIGGAQLYQSALHAAQRVYATEIYAEFDADAFFPAMDGKDWHESSREHHGANEKNAYPLDFVVYDRIK